MAGATVPFGSNKNFRLDVPYNCRTLVAEAIMSIKSTSPTTKDRRVEFRTDAATEALIAEAADLLHLTKSSFVSEVAKREAEKVVARADRTLMAPDVFDALIASLDTPDDSPELERLAKLPKLIRR
jgi:uncharacterized protein (DUF1778 family)